MSTIRSRREPPSFRAATVVAVEPRGERLVRLTVAGPELDGLDIGLPAASVRLLVPDVMAEGPGGSDRRIEIPVWNGNEFLRADGSRPPIRTLTPVRFDPDQPSLDVEVLVHGDGPLSTWVAGDPGGDPTAISGTGRGYTIDPAARSFLLAGDESAVPAISVILRALPAEATVTVLIEATEPVRDVDLPDHPGSTITWLGLGPGDRPGDALAAAIATTELAADARVWGAGEAAGVHRIRQHLFEDRGVPRDHAVIRGYWKVARGGDAETG